MRKAVVPFIIALFVNSTVIAVERPSDAELHAYKAYHHARYMETTAAEAGGNCFILKNYPLKEQMQ